MESINPVYNSVKALAPNENLHEWELPIDINSKIRLYNRPSNYAESSSSSAIPIFSLSIPKPTMLLVENIIKNHHMKNNEVFNMCEPEDRVILIETSIDNKKKYKPANFDFSLYKKAKKKTAAKSREGFGSQISFWILDEIDSDKIHKVKIFNGSDEGSRVQIPGVTNKGIIINIFNYLIEYLNKYIKDSQIPLVTFDTIKELGESRKCNIVIPEDIFIDFGELRNCLKDVKRLQAESLTAPTSNPLFQIIWPIFKVSGKPFQKKCKFSIYNPIVDGKKNNKIPATNIEFNSIKKENNSIFYHSIIFSGKAEERHINYVYRFLWEFLSCYQHRIFYKKNSEFDKDDLNLFEEIMKLEKKIKDSTINLPINLSINSPIEFNPTPINLPVNPAPIIPLNQ
jgi:hypothetical protein